MSQIVQYFVGSINFLESVLVDLDSQDSSVAFKTNDDPIPKRPDGSFDGVNLYILYLM